MTPGIMEWLRTVAQPHLPVDYRAVEIGARNINGRARDALTGWSIWHGWDTEEGTEVTHKGRFYDSGYNYGVVVACEVFEHDVRFWETNHEARMVVIRNHGFYIVTTPYLGFPYHSYGGDFYRFTEDAYREVFFHRLHIVDLRVIGEGAHQTVCGIAHL
jgi:hypothetical protein